MRSLFTAARGLCVLAAWSVCLPPIPPSTAAEEPAPGDHEAAPPSADATPARRPRVPPVPDGSPEELLEYVDRIADPALLPESPGRQRYYRRKCLANTVESADRILAQVAPGDPMHGRALRLKLDALKQLDRLHDPHATEALAAFAAELAAGPDEALAAEAKAIASRGVPQPGNPMPLEGRLLDGADFDPAMFAGKVVLVDFWATWCGPCVAEIANIRNEYDRHHDRGFEVLGISLDDDRAALEAFVADRGIPWPVIVDAAAAAGGGETMAERYGVNAIPRCILVGRDGTVISTDARGGRLGELLAEQFPENEAAP